jgi:hypothetical protein
MKIKYALSKTNDIILEMEKQNTRERLISYSIITAILNDLDKIAEEKETPNYEFYRHELLWSCKSMCGLDDGNGHSANQHTILALEAIDKLKSVNCFDVLNLKQKISPK